MYYEGVTRKTTLDLDDQDAHPDWLLVLKHGGTSRVAEMLGYKLQRVQNWKLRGVPSKVKLARPDLFQPRRSKREKVEGN